jgi:hypothetical protein
MLADRAASSASPWPGYRLENTPSYSSRTTRTNYHKLMASAEGNMMKPLASCGALRTLPLLSKRRETTASKPPVPSEHPRAHSSTSSLTVLRRSVNSWTWRMPENLTLPAFRSTPPGSRRMALNGISSPAIFPEHWGDRSANADSQMASTRLEFPLNEETRPPGLGGTLNTVRVRSSRRSTRQRVGTAASRSPTAPPWVDEVS